MIRFAAIIFSLLILMGYSCQEKNSSVSAGDTTSAQPERLALSPYPASNRPDKLFIINDRNFSPAQLLTIETLQGVLAQTKPKIYRLANDGDAQWLEDLKNNYGVEVDYSLQANFEALLSHFKNDIAGYIVCNVNDQTVNTAISLCGITKAVAITAENIPILEALGIPLLKDVRNTDDAWFFTHYADSINNKILCYQMEDRFTFLADYAVFGKMITFYSPLTSALTQNIFAFMQPNSPLLGWGSDEFQLVYHSSANSIPVHPADWAKNLSTLTNFSVSLKQQTATPDTQITENVHTVCFVMTDGDNVQWLLNDFTTNSRWYGSPNRSQVKLGWTISPALSELAPTVMKYIYDRADDSDNGKDYFIAGPSGLGYIFPDRYKNLATYASLTSQFMEKADLRIINIIGNTMAEEYLKPFSEQQNIDAIFFYYFSNYSGGKGKINWINGKPVITGRFNLWEGFETPESLAEKLNYSSTDIHSEKGYSLIPVHVWSKGVDDVLRCISLLNKNVKVVTPDELVYLIRKNLYSGN
ncbi:GxGYxYP domain-containing protein [Calditrichota bacterium LG25]